MNDSTPKPCGACGAVAVVDGVCTRCGTPTGESNRCPHCSAVARAEPRGVGAKGGAVTWVCGACGGPRMPIGAGGLGGDAVAQPLREAKASQAIAARGALAFWVFAPIAAFMSLIVLAAWPLDAFVAKLIILALAAMPAWFALRARQQARRAKAAAADAMNRAWLGAAEGVAASSKNGITVAELASRLKIDETRADQLLTALAVHDRTRIDVDDAADVRYSIEPTDMISTAGRLRIDPSEDAFRELEASEAEATQAAIDEAAEPKLTAPFPRGPNR